MTPLRPGPVVHLELHTRHLPQARRLEGIQNFFLVVEVRKQLKGLCLADQVPPHARGRGTIGSEVLGRLPGVA